MTELKSSPLPWIALYPRTILGRGQLARQAFTLQPEMVGYGLVQAFEMCEANAALAVRSVNALPEVLAALKIITRRYVELAGSGDCGHWNPEEERQVIAARAAIANAERGEQ